MDSNNYRNKGTINKGKCWPTVKETLTNSTKQNLSLIEV